MFFEFNHYILKAYFGYMKTQVFEVLTGTASLYQGTSENKEITGILLLDLSAAFDTLDIMCNTLALHGFDKL